MAAQTFTVRNNGQQSFELTGIQFNTPTGISHVANLANLFTGASQTFTGNVYAGSTTLAPGATRSFSVDHFYVSGAASSAPRTGSIIVTASGGRSATIVTNVRVNQSATPTYALSRSVSQVNEGGSFTITLSTTGLSNGTLVPYTITGVNSADIGGAQLQGNFTVINNVSNVVFQTTQDFAETANETFVLTLNGIGTSVSVLIVNTSPAPVPAPVTPTPAPVTPTPAPVTPTPAPVAPASYTLAVSPQNSVEGATAGIKVTLNSTNVPQNLLGQTINWKVVDKFNPGGISAANPSAIPPVIADFAGTIQNGELIGSMTLSSPITEVTLFTNNNRRDTGTRTFTFSIPSGIGGTSVNSVDFIVTEAGAVVPQYSIINAAASVNEGSNYTFTIVNTNQTNANGTQILYTIEGIGTTTSADFGTPSVATMNNYQANVSIPITADGWNSGQWTELNERFRVYLNADNSVSTPEVTINNTSRPNYSLTLHQPGWGAQLSAPYSVQEGASVYFRFQDTNNVTPSNAFRFVIAGDIDLNDIVPNPSLSWSNETIGGALRIVSSTIPLDGAGAYQNLIEFLNTDVVGAVNEAFYLVAQQVNPALAVPPYVSGAGIPGEVTAIGPIYVLEPPRLTISDPNPPPIINSAGTLSGFRWITIGSRDIYSFIGSSFPVTMNVEVFTVNSPSSVNIIISTYNITSEAAIIPINQTVSVPIVNNQGTYSFVVNPVFNVTFAAVSYITVWASYGSFATPVNGFEYHYTLYDSSAGGGGGGEGDGSGGGADGTGGEG